MNGEKEKSLTKQRLRDKDNNNSQTSNQLSKRYQASGDSNSKRGSGQQKEQVISSLESLRVGNWVDSFLVTSAPNAPVRRVEERTVLPVSPLITVFEIASSLLLSSQVIGFKIALFCRDSRMEGPAEHEATENCKSEQQARR